MATKKNQLSSFVSFIAWLTSVIVSLAVGLALVNGTLIVPYIGIINEIAGWIVVLTTVLGAILVIAHKLK